MCYDISFSTSIESILNVLPGVSVAPQLDLFSPSYHKLGMSYPQWPIVVNQNNRMELHPFIWGPIPKRLNTEALVKKERPLFLNAKSEKVLVNGTMWNAIRHQRCLIPVTGFYEYRELTKNIKQAYFIRQSAAPVFFIAGLWVLSNSSLDKDNQEKTPTFTLITRTANSVMKQIHNGGRNPGRMPMMLTPGLAESWLAPEATDFQLQELLNFSFPSEGLDYWPVNSVRKAHSDDESLIAHVDETAIPKLQID